MKIIGFLHIHGHREMVLSADSAMLNQPKPFFLPEWTNDVRYTPSLVLRVCRLGKNISPKFASRYFDAVTDGSDFIAWDRLEEAIANGHSWTETVAFDGSLGLGNWVEITDSLSEALAKQKRTNDDLIISPEEAIAEASRVMTIRQGDLIYIHTCEEPIPARAEEVTLSGNKIK